MHVIIAFMGTVIMLMIVLFFFAGKAVHEQEMKIKQLTYDKECLEDEKVTLIKDNNLLRGAIEQNIRAREEVSAALKDVKQQLHVTKQQLTKLRSRNKTLKDFK